MYKNKKDVLALHTISYTLSGFIALICLIPFLMIVSASISDENLILKNGFSLLPQGLSLMAYQTVFEKPEVILRAYANTIVLTLTGTFVGLFLTSMTAYVLQRQDFEWRNKFSFYFYFTTLFSGGLVPYYILMIRYFHLKNSYLALLLPMIFRPMKNGQCMKQI